MRPYRLITLASTLALLTGCSHLVWQAAQLPGLRQVSDSMNEKAFVDWMESDPKSEVQARVAQGEYRLLGLARDDQDDYWIPGVAGHKSDHGRFDVIWQGMGGGYEKHIPTAEKYMAEFNRSMLSERRGVALDVYARGPQNTDYSGPIKR